MWSQQILQFKSRPLHRSVLMSLSCIARAKRAAAAQLATIIPQTLKIVEDDCRYFSGLCPRLKAPISASSLTPASDPGPDISYISQNYLQCLQQLDVWQTCWRWRLSLLASEYFWQLPSVKDETSGCWCSCEDTCCSEPPCTAGLTLLLLSFYTVGPTTAQTHPDLERTSTFVPLCIFNKRDC